MRGHDVPVFGDFALMSSPGAPVPAGPVLGINPINLGAQANGMQDRAEAVLRAGQEWHRLTGGRVKVFTTGLDEDAVVAARLADDVVHPQSLSELREAVAGCDVVLASRLHAAIIAIDHGVPVVGVATTTKMRDFLEDCGVGGQVADVDRTWDASALTSLLREATPARPAFPDRGAVLDELACLVRTAS
jgi:polysaccharide pyruvyl transferase WcaK-like protein